MPLFRFSVLMVLIMGVLFLLGGIIKSNFGYPPTLEIPGQGYQSAPSGHAGDTLAAAMNNQKLWSPWPLPAGVQPPNALTRQLEEEIFKKTNEQRGQRSLEPLTGEEGLSLTARYHSVDMAAKGFFDHQNLENVGPSFRAAKLHRRYIGSIGENLYRMTKDTGDVSEAAERIMRGWMNSPGHRDNILRKTFDVLGVGCYEHLEDNRPWVYATQVFGTRIATLAQDFPAKLKPLQAVTIRVETVNPGYLAAAAVLWVDTANRSRENRFPLTAVTGKSRSAEGKLTAPGAKGLYQLVFHIPEAGNSNTYSICPGPLFTVE